MNPETIRTITETGIAIGTLFLGIMTFLAVSETHIQMKRDRLFREMDNLISPLFNNIGSGKDARFDHYAPFFERVRPYIYLAPSDLRKALEDYFEQHPWDMARSNELDDMEKALIEKVRQRYSDLTEKIHQIENKRPWQGWK